jgi:hypothetical protein
MAQPALDGMGRFAHRYASLIAFWNHAEGCGRQIAQLLLGESAMSFALTAEVGNRTLMQAIQVASHEKDGIGEHLRHFTIGFETMLSYRNFYVHSLYAIEHNGLVPGDYEGILFSQDGKGRAKYFNRRLTIKELEAAISGVHKLNAYGSAIQKELGETGDGLEDLLQAYGASLEKPDWPPCVEKTPLYLHGQAPPPPKPSRKRQIGNSAN